MPFNELFGGNTIYPSDPTFLNLALTADVTFQWPLEQNMAGPTVLAAEIEVTPDAGGHSVFMPDATQGSTGYTTTFYNAGAFSFTVKDFAGNTLGVVTSGTAWTLWLRSVATQAGLWRVFQMGAATSAANAADLAGAGLVAISTTLNEQMVITNKNTNYAIVSGDRASGLKWTGGTGTFTLPDPAAVGSGWFVALKNGGSGPLTVDPNGAETIDGASSLLLQLEDSSWVVTDGVDWFTFGLGQSTSSVFDFLSMSAAGTGDLVLSGSQLNRVSYEFTGVLTGNRNIIVPATIQQYWVFNNTSGAFTLTVKCAGGVDPGVLVPQGTRIILYCTGTNVVNAETNTASLPAVVQGDLLYGSGPGTLSTLPKSTTPNQVLTNSGGSNNPAWGDLSGASLTYPLTPQDGDKIEFGTGDRFDIYATAGGNLFIEGAGAAAVNAIFLGSISGVGPAITIGNFGGTRNVGLSRPYVTSTAGSVGGGALNLGMGTDPAASAGGATLPANPVGFLVWNLSGTTIKIPYYAA